MIGTLLFASAIGTKGLVRPRFRTKVYVQWRVQCNTVRPHSSPGSKPRYRKQV